MTRASKWSIIASILALTIGADQLTKEWATNRLSGGRSIDVLPTVDFRLAYNSGFSFSTGSGQGSLIAVLVIALCGFIGWQIWRETLRGRVVLFAVILGGALGNLLDRIFRADDGFLSGKVVDFIDVDWYAVFNLADSFVVCGCIAFVVYELRHRAGEQRDLEAASQAAGSSTEPSPSD